MVYSHLLSLSPTCLFFISLSFYPCLILSHSLSLSFILSLFHSIFFSLFLSLSPDPALTNATPLVVGWPDEAKEGDKITIELDLRSQNPEERCAFFHVNDSLQQYCVVGLPPSVRFTVSFSLSLSFLFLILHSCLSLSSSSPGFICRA